jgi:hypothetical protein
MSTNDIQLPHGTNTSVNLYTNETPDTATLNRVPDRLLKNDLKLKEVLEGVLCTEIGEGLLGEIGDFLSIDGTYIQEQLEGIVNGEVSPYALGSLTDVILTNLDHGDLLTYDSEQELWVNGLGEMSTIEAAFTQELSYVGGIEHISVSVSPTFTQSNTLNTYTYTYPLDQFTSTEGNIDHTAIKGFTISAQLFGRLDTNTIGNGSDWTIKATYPDGNSYNILKYHCQNIDDDGGIGTTIFVPFDPSLSNELIIDVSLPNHDLSALDTESLSLNYFKIENIALLNDGIGITPDVTIELINGTVDTTDANVKTNGYVDELVLAGAGHDIWTSRDDNITTVQDWSTIFPINTPQRTAKTEIQFENYLVVDGSGSTDPGADSGSSGKAEGTIFIDWLKGKVIGTVTLYNGSDYSVIGSGFLSGVIGGA